MKKVLIALDYSPSATEVAEAGYELAKSMNAETILLHVIGNPTYYSSSVYAPIMGYGGFVNLDFQDAQIIGLITNESHVYLEHVKRHLKDEFIDMIVKEGNISDMILETAKRLEVNVIVMGVHSQQWLEEVLIGSETKRVLQHSKIPMLLVPVKREGEL